MQVLTWYCVNKYRNGQSLSFIYILAHVLEKKRKFVKQNLEFKQLPPGLWTHEPWKLKQVINKLNTTWKVSKYGVFSGPYFPVFGLNTEKYGPERTPYFHTFHVIKNCHTNHIFFRALDYERWKVKQVINKLKVVIEITFSVGLCTYDLWKLKQVINKQKIVIEITFSVGLCVYDPWKLKQVINKLKIVIQITFSLGLCTYERWKVKHVVNKLKIVIQITFSVGLCSYDPLKLKQVVNKLKIVIQITFSVGLCTCEPWKVK